MKQKTLLVLALLVIVLAFAGIPRAWKQMLLILTAFGIAYAAYSEEIKIFFMPRINHDAAAADAFSPVEPPANQTVTHEA